MARFHKLLLCLFIFQLQIIPAAGGKSKAFIKTDFNRERLNKPVSKTMGFRNTPGISAVDAARRALAEHTSGYGGDSAQYDFQLVRVMSSPAGNHFTFHPTIRGMPVYGADINITINQEKSVVYLSAANRFNFTVDARSLPVEAEEAVMRALQFLQVDGDILVEPESELMIFNSSKFGAVAAYRVTLVTLNPFGDWEIFVHARTGVILQALDRMRYQGYSNGKGLVYDPDPLTRMQTEYGGPYSDNNDNDTPALASARDTVILREIYFDGVNYHLRGPYCRLFDVEPPVDVFPEYASSDSFYFSRSQAGFEAVMVYYHIDKCMRRLRELGFEVEHLYEFKADPHGFDGADQSHFSISGNYCAFGEGGVDDAEDADVIWHEYTHAIQYHITGDMLYDGETMAVMEGSADYWAASYSRSKSDYNWHFVYNWDGHNEFWKGRVCNKAWHYPEDVQGLLFEGRNYEAGQLWSSVLMHIWSDLGRDITDKLFIQAHYLWGINPGFQDAADAMVKADTLLYNGEHLSVILYWFDQYGLVDMNNYLPRIEHIPLTDSEETQGPFIIEAEITPSTAPLDQQHLKLYWQYAAGSIDSLPLERVGESDTYVAEIIGADQSDWIHYYLSASDLSGNAVSAPQGAPENYYAFYAGPDTVKPAVVYVSLKDQSLNAWPPVIRLMASDNVAVETALAAYYINQMQMPGSFMLEEIEKNRIYEQRFSIPGEQLQIGDSVFYRITISDGASTPNVRMVPETGYYGFKIKEGKTDQIYTFEINDGGFLASGEWAWGTPTTGPASGQSSQMCWATNLSGRYRTLAQLSSLQMPEIDLSGYGNVAFSFYHWYETEKERDGGNVKLSDDGGISWSVIYPVSDYDGELSTTDLAGEAAFSGSSRGWCCCQFNLSAYCDQKIRIKFDFAADDTVSLSGWYIDNVLIRDAALLPPPKKILAASGYLFGVPVSWYMPDNRYLNKHPAGIAENISLLGYTIYRRSQLTAHFDSLTTIFTADKTSYIDADAIRNHPYSYYVKALYTDGESMPSNISSAIACAYAPVEVINQTTGEINALTITNKGNIGYTVSADEDTLLGGGMIVNGFNILNEGAFLVGISPRILADAAHNELGLLQDDFMPLAPITTTDQGNWTLSQTIYNDAHAYLPLGIQVKQKVYSRIGDKFIIWTADIGNHSGMDLSDLVAGFYFDWDWPGGEYGGKQQAVWNGEFLDAGYLTNGEALVGVVLLSHYYFHAYRILNNHQEADRSHMTKSDKWIYLNQSNIPDDETLKDRSQLFSIALSDYSWTLHDGDSLFLAFAVVSAEDLGDFLLQCGMAFQAYTDMGYDRSGLIIERGNLREAIPYAYDLSQNHPNPFNNVTMINYQLPMATEVELSVYNLLGQKIATLVSKQQPAGYYQIAWDGKNQSGQIMASGVYFCRLEAGSHVRVRKMLYIK